MIRSLSLAWHFLKYRPRRIHPFEIQAVLLNGCNLRCVYCRCPDVPSAQLTAGQWCDLLRQLARAGTYRVKFQGGEPTLRKDFGTICSAAKQARMVTAVVTNGYGIAERPSLLDHLDEVVVSLDALSPALHDRYRGSGSHRTAMQALDLALERGRRVYINMVVHRDTWAELEPMLEMCERRRIGLNAQAVMFGCEYQDPEAAYLRLPEDAERAMYRQLAAWKRLGRPLLFSAGSYAHAAAWPDYAVLARRGRSRSSCMAGRDYIHIEPNGDVHPCGLHAADFTPRNAVRDGLDAALRHAQHHNCEDCAFAYLNERKAVFGLRPSAVLGVLRRG